MSFYVSPYYLIFSSFAVLLLWLGQRTGSKRACLTVLNLAVFTLIFSVWKGQAVILASLAALGFCSAKLVVRIPAKYLLARRSILWLAIGGLVVGMFISTGEVPAEYRVIRVFGHLSASEFLCVSFFVIRMIHVLVDAEGGEVGKLSAVDLLNYLFFFPLFISGPVSRYQDFLSDLERSHSPSWEGTYHGLHRIIVGYFKKFVLANSLSFFSIDQLSNWDIAHLPKWKVLIALYTFTIVLYLDFSGYTDAAIGISGLLGFRCPENFNRPLLAVNLQEFWNRWHISFINWLKQYVYFPLSSVLYRSGLRNFTVISALSTWLTFVLAGFWHGFGLNYLFYGLYHAFGLTVLMLFRQLNLDTKMPKALSWFVTFNFISFGWFFFLNKVPL